MNAVETSQLAAALRARGLIVGKRDYNRNTAFQGCWMVAEPIARSKLPTHDASDGAYCAVGFNLVLLMEEAQIYFEVEY